MQTTSDPLGHILLQTRLHQSITELDILLKQSISPPKHPLASSILTTGIGSSEAHARFFSYLINQYTYSTSEFTPIASFYHSPTKNKSVAKPSTLALFSQGLSPNASLPLKHQDRFQATLLFTACEKLPPLVPQTTVIQFPIPNEFQSFLRIIGPLCAYLAAIQAILTYFPKNTLPAIPNNFFEILQNTEERLPPSLDPFLNIPTSGCSILASPPLSLYANNLSLKFLEGVFSPPPPVYDLLSFAHGPFQQLVKNPQPLIILTSNSPDDKELLKHVTPLLENIKAPHWILLATLPHPWSIFEFECILNHFVFKLIQMLKINQRRWPGQHLDSPLYNLNQPFTP